MNLLSHFDRVYILNLPERHDRRAEVEAELARHGLVVDGQKIRWFRAIRPEDAGDFPSIGARGCFLSHLAMIEEALRDQLASVLICEDDLMLDPRTAQPDSSLLWPLCTQAWDFAYLGHPEALPDHGQPARWGSTRQPLATTHCYALSRQVLPALREHLQNCLARPSGHPLGSPMHVDGAYSLFRQQHPEVLTLLAMPSLAGQRSSRSDIYPNRWYDRIPLLARLAGQLRRIKTAWRRQRTRFLQHGGKAHV